MPRTRSAVPSVIVLVLFPLLLFLLSCGEDETPPDYAQEAVDAHRRLNEVAAELADHRERTAKQDAELEALRARTSAAEARAEERAHEARSEQMERRAVEGEVDAAEADFLLSGAVGFSCVLLVLVLVHLLLRERRQRMVLVRFLRMLKGKGAP